ncbi:MAG: late competence development ComFB family protein [Cyanobacteria bacterium KgW148]|nr:late competence development ComFB family protein [Cyanobacteria bacterium KgW148]
MDDYKNVIETLVFQEIKEQVEALKEGIRETISLNEVAAYALNRLPTLYATSRDGWHQQHERAEKELKPLIVQQVKRAIMAVRRDTLREPDPIPPEEMVGEARALAQVKKVLDRADLTWNEVPKAVEEAIKLIKIRGTLDFKKLSKTRRNAVVVQDYIKRRRRKEGDWKREESLSYFGSKSTTQEREFSTFLEAEAADFVNVLERLVHSLTEQYLQRLSPQVRQKVVLHEVVAYTLNRVPPMYATTAKGLKQLRLKAKEEYGKKIVTTIHEAVTTIVQNPHRSVSPLPFKRKQGDCQRALEQLKQILNHREIDCNNVALVISEALEQTISGFLA